MDIDIDNIPEPNWDIHEPIIEGFVLWWSNLHGRGQIKEIGGNEEVLTIYAWDIIPIYGALLTGVTVQYQRTENRNFKNFRVKRGMGCVLYVLKLSLFSGMRDSKLTPAGSASKTFVQTRLSTHTRT